MKFQENSHYIGSAVDGFFLCFDDIIVNTANIYDIIKILLRRYQHGL